MNGCCCKGPPAHRQGGWREEMTMCLTKPSKSKDLYDNVIQHVVISAMEGINGRTFPPVSVMKSLVKCWVLTVFPPPLCS
ncbi:hypothetical protein GBAR_LOCUS10374 [Geodia barretti]|uniref:Uncharacterized protein n=1 Tax=Geodia barretti TaxID=519541 RepID=A0AA35RVB4_GEOBA|nr:hypothetical protein GBAR_LOCUS10374 [Geodia barretti]